MFSVYDEIDASTNSKRFLYKVRRLKLIIAGCIDCENLCEQACWNEDSLNSAVVL